MISVYIRIATSEMSSLTMMTFFSNNKELKSYNILSILLIFLNSNSKLKFSILNYELFKYTFLKLYSIFCSGNWRLILCKMLVWKCKCWKTTEAMNSGPRLRMMLMTSVWLSSSSFSNLSFLGLMTVSNMNYKKFVITPMIGAEPALDICIDSITL